MCITSFSQPYLMEKPLPKPTLSNLETALLINCPKMQHISTVVMYPPYVMRYTPYKKQVPSCPFCLPFPPTFRTNFCIPSSPPMNLMWDLLHAVTFHCSLVSVHQGIAEIITLVPRLSRISWCICPLLSGVWVTAGPYSQYTYNMLTLPVTSQSFFTLLNTSKFPASVGKNEKKKKKPCFPESEGVTIECQVLLWYSWRWRYNLATVFKAIFNPFHWLPPLTIFLGSVLNFEHAFHTLT